MYKQHVVVNEHKEEYRIEKIFNEKRENLTEDEINHCERIIKNKEEKSYSKLLKTLQSK